MAVAIFRNGGAFTSMDVDNIITNVHLVQHSARNTYFLKRINKMYIGKKLAQNRAKQSTGDGSNSAGVCVKCLLWAELQSIERR